MRSSFLAGLLLMLASALLSSGPAYAQESEATHSINFRGAPLEMALGVVAELTGINLVFTSDLVEGKRIYCMAEDKTTDEILRCLLQDTGLDYIRSSDGTYIVVQGTKHPARLGYLAGSVTDADSGMPLPYANVILADASIGASTDSEGMFALSKLLEGPQRVLVTYVGYEPAEETVVIIPGQQERINIALEPREISLAPIVISGLEQRIPSRMLGIGEQSAQDLERLSGQGTLDVMRGASRLPGISSLQPLADLQVQGSAAGDHLTLLDGVPIRDPVSLGRYLGAFSPLAIERLRVHKAGFGVAHGSHLTGVVAVEQRRRAAPGRWAAVSIDPVSTNARLQASIPMEDARSASIMAAYRASNWGLFEDPGVRNLLEAWTELDPLQGSIWIQQPADQFSLQIVKKQQDVQFSDAHVSVDIPLNQYKRLSGMLYRATNSLSSHLTAVSAVPTEANGKLMLTGDDYDWTNWAGHLRHSWIWGARTTASVQTRGSWHTSEVGYKALQDLVEADISVGANESQFRDYEMALSQRNNGNEAHHIREFGFEFNVDYSLNPGNLLNMGLEVMHTHSRIGIHNPVIPHFDYDANSTDVAAFLQPAFSIGTQWRIEPGLRTTYVPAREALFAEPRLALRFDDANGQYAARVAAGLYRQFTNQFELTSFGVTSVVPWILFWLPVDQTVAPPRAYHFTSEFLWMPSDRLTLTVEGYYKDQQRMLLLDYNRLQNLLPIIELSSVNQTAFVNATEGFAAGVSSQVSYRLPQFNMAVAYARSHAELRYPNRFNNERQPTPGQVPHQLQIEADVSLSTTLRLEGVWKGQWGRSWSLRRTYYDYLSFRIPGIDFGPFDINNPGEHKVPDYQVFDVGFVYAPKWQRTQLQFRAFVLNALNRENVYDFVLSPDKVALPRSLPGRQFTLSLRVEY